MSAMRPATAKLGWTSCGQGPAFDLALMDWNMPVMDGLEMLRGLRAEGFANVKVMMVTTEAENDFILRALDAGADEYLMKPFDRGRAYGEAGVCWNWWRSEPMPSGGPKRILIVDDSAVMRSLLRKVVSSDPGLYVAGTASDGASALSSVDVLKPDLILLDVEMPVMDGLVTLKQLRARGHKMPVVMCSSLTQRGARVTLEALAAGASDYVAKPSGQASIEEATKKLAQELGPKMHALTNPAAHSTHGVFAGTHPGVFPGATDGPGRVVFPCAAKGGPMLPIGQAPRSQAITIAAVGAGNRGVNRRAGGAGYCAAGVARGVSFACDDCAAYAGAVYEAVCREA